MACEPPLKGLSCASHRGGALTVRLARTPPHPGRIAVSKTDYFIDGGTFFLDFTRPIEIHRHFGKLDGRVGLIVELIVPVIHEAEERGERQILVYPGDPHFDDLCALWKAYYPSEAEPPFATVNRHLQKTDFVAQFPGEY
jgi:hypothetical protein